MLDKSKNANPKFSNTLVPIHVWVMNTQHGIDADEVRSDLSFVPRAILEKMLSYVTKEDRQEAHIFVVAHDKETGDYKAYLGHVWGSKEKDKGENAFSNLQSVGDIGEDMIQNIKLNELHMQYRPDWHGKREEPVTRDTNSIEEVMDFLEETKTKDLFMRVFPLTDTTDSPVTALVPSPITKKEAKPPKMTKAKREALVKRFGEDKIKELETRMGIDKKNDGKNKKR